jgi:G:T/U-mismatch repair DNA glycosylase
VFPQNENGSNRFWRVFRQSTIVTRSIAQQLSAQHSKASLNNSLLCTSHGVVGFEFGAATAYDDVQQRPDAP